MLVLTQFLIQLAPAVIALLIGFGALSIIWFTARGFLFYVQLRIREGKDVALRETSRRFFG